MTDKQEPALPDPAYEIAMHESFDFPRPIPYLGYDRLPVGTKLYTADAIHAAVAAERERATEEANRRANASWSLMAKKMVEAEREACIAALEALNLWDYDDPASSAIAAIQGDQT